ncbi:MAG TPA: phosphatase PAP2 family protein [Gemmatimonadales bacterium]|jgi:undecaprenyl-diphosphatase|nr:phosphatase PAP2 family protein [Gemmatimonadales bacterium]
MHMTSPPEPRLAEPGSGPRIGTALAAGLVAAAIALAFFAWLGYQVHSGPPTGFDLAGRAALRSLETETMSAIMWGASVYGAPVRLSPVGLVAATVFLYRGWRRGALLVLVTLAGAWALDTALKLSFGRARPRPFFDYYPAPESYSFPSGHALFAVCFFGGLAVLLTHRLERRSLQTAVWVLALCIILLIGASRVYLGVHYPTDVLGGFAVGVVWVAAVALGDRLAEHRRRR